MAPETANWQQYLEHATLTDLGLRRGNNQDALKVMLASSETAWRQRGHLFMVADGMGAHAAGELASKLAVDTVPLAYLKLQEKSAPEALRTAVHEANAHIHSRGAASPDFKGMGTTCTVLAILPRGGILAQVGDSRCYRVRNNRIEQLSFDHSLVWEMRAAGQIPANQVPDYIPKNVITRSLGPNPQVQVDIEGPIDLAVGDMFLLCSDGLSGQVRDDEIGKVLKCLPPAEAVRTLVDLANLRGGPDNITIVIVRVAAPAPGGGKEAAAPAVPRVTHPVHPAVWAALCAFGVIGVGLLACGLPLLGLASLAGAAVTAGIAWFQRYGGQESFSWSGPRLGRGPYTAADCTPNAPFAKTLAGLAEELREAATQEDWVIDWSRFRGHVGRAAAAAQAGDYLAAGAEYCHAISFMMAELKQQRRKDG